MDLAVLIFMYVIVGLLGLFIGSFLNVCICRIPNKESIAFPASHCTSCAHKLGIFDLFPLFSWIFLKGKCRYCSEKISVQYPIIEFTNMILWLFLFWQFGLTLKFIFSAVIFSILLVLTVIDIYHMILPDVLVLCCLVMCVFYTVFVRGQYIDSLLGLVLGGGFFFLIVLLSKGRAMGMGDVKLVAVLSFLIGFKATILACGLAFVIGAVCCVILLSRKKVEGRTAVPFGPFICVGFAISFLYAEPIVNWYLSLMTF